MMKLFGALFLFAGFFMFTTACNSGGNHADNGENKDTTLVKMKVEVSSQTAAQVDSFLQTYYQLKDRLVKDDTDAGTKLSDDLLAAANHISLKAISDTVQRDKVAQDIRHLKNSIKALQEDTSLADVRSTFETISLGTYRLIKNAGLKDITVYRTYCPMAFNNEGAYWLSDKSAVRNPYFGRKMITCGIVKETLKF